MCKKTLIINSSAQIPACFFLREYLYASINLATCLVVRPSTQPHLASLQTYKVGQAILFFRCQFVFIQIFFKLLKSHFFSFFRNLFFYFSKNFDCVKCFFFFSFHLHCIQFPEVNVCQVGSNHNVNLLSYIHEFYKHLQYV